MTERIIIHELEPESYQAMMGLEKYLNQTGLSKSLKELIKIRASQISRPKSFLLIMKIAEIIVAIGVINRWNRFAVTTHMVFEGL